MKTKLLTFLLALTFLFLFSGLLSGCATVEDVQKRLGTFHGLTENDLVQRWGIPTSVYEKDGVRYVQYSHQESAFMPGSQPIINTYEIGGYHYTSSIGGTPGMNINCSCRFIFEVVNDIIVRTSFNGTPCGCGKEFPLGRPLVVRPTTVVAPNSDCDNIERWTSPPCTNPPPAYDGPTINFEKDMEKYK